MDSHSTPQGDSAEHPDPNRLPTSPGTIVGGDRITIGDIGNSVVAAGAGAQALVTNIDTYVDKYIKRVLTEAEKAEQARAMEHKRLVESVKSYVQRLQNQVAEARQMPLTGNPYKYVTAFELPDSNRFAGRDALAKQLLDKMVCNDSLCRFVVLDGRAGVGKTSLLRAGVVPALVGAEHLPLIVHLTPSADISLATAIKKVLLPDLSATPLLAQAPLRVFLRQVADPLPKGKRVFVLLDQFEAVLELGDEVLEAFREELTACLFDDDPRDHWLICIDAGRTTELNRIFQPTISYPLANTLKVPFLSREEALAAVTEPAKRYGISCDENLVTTLLNDLGEDEIDPSYLQVVCYALVEALPEGERALTLTFYKERGGAPGVLGAYLDRVMGHMPERDRETGWQVLVALSEMRGSVASENELISRLRIEGVREAATRRALEQLQHNGLVRDESGQILLATELFMSRIRVWAREWAAQRAVSEQIRTELRRQAEHIVGSALRGLIGGALGFGLAFWVAFYAQVQFQQFMLHRTLFRILPGAFAGLVVILAADVAVASYEGRRGRWLPWMWGGGGGAVGFALALTYHSLLDTAADLTDRPLLLLLRQLPVAIEGAIWGFVAGLGVVWVMQGERDWRRILAKMLSASVAASVILWLVDLDLGLSPLGTRLPAWLSSGGRIGDAFLYPEPPGLLFVAGAVMPLFIMGAALLPELKLGQLIGGLRSRQGKEG